VETPSRKGAIAEAAIATEAVKLGVFVLRPFVEGGRSSICDWPLLPTTKRSR
jgi:hypothetical protein